LYNKKSQGGTADATAYRIFAKRYSTTNASWQWMFPSNGTPNKGVFWVYPASGNAYSHYMIGTIPIAQWTHVACVFDTAVGSIIYINGKQNRTTTATTGFTVRASITVPVLLGASVDNGVYSKFYNGSFDEVRISKTSRSANWINTTYQTESNPGTFLAFNKQNNDTFYSTTNDGNVSSSGISYKTIHDQLLGDVASSSLNTMNIGQQYGVTSTFFIYRGFLFFDTSSIPDTATIVSAYLLLYNASDHSTSDFDFTIRNGQPDSPHDPLQTSDYYYANYSGDGGSVNTSKIRATGYFTISLDGTGLSWISKTGTTKLCLEGSGDINDRAPTQNQYMTIYSADQGRGFKPKLYVTYTMP
jgi:hypothetical protein